MEKLKAAGLAERCSAIEGIFFESILAGAEAYPLPLDHSRTDEQRIQTLSDFRNVIPANGKLLNR